MNTAACRLLAATLVGTVLAGPLTRTSAQEDAAPSARAETLRTDDGRRVEGRLLGDADGGFRFVPADGGPPIPLAAGAEIDAETAGAQSIGGHPPFQVRLGRDQRISGRLDAVTPAHIVLAEGPGGAAVRVARHGASALLQRPGEVQVFADGFEAIDPERWARQTGEPETTTEPKLFGSKCLRLPAGGASLTARLAEPVASGRLEVAYFEDGTRAGSQSWFVDLTFRERGSELTTVRAVLGWGGDTLAVESPGGPSLAVQPLERKPGWHRLTVRFGPGRTDLTVDGDELAHGNPPGGPLVEIRLATQTNDGSKPPAGLAAYLDDLRVARLVEPVGRMETAPEQDELRLVTGDQLFGLVTSADARQVRIEVAGKPVEYPWTEVAGLRFARVPEPSALLDGLLVRVEWLAAPEVAARDVDRVEGTLRAAGTDDLTIATPYAGTLTIPGSRLRRLVVLGKTRRLVLDPYAHHLGNLVDDDLDPPQPEGGRLERTFDLESVPPGAAFLVVDVVEAVGESGNPDFSAEIREGFLRTEAELNGTTFDYLNRHIDGRNETPERVRLPIPDGLLKPGRNVLRLVQKGRRDKPDSFDNLGLLGVALEFDPAPAGGAQGPRP